MRHKRSQWISSKVNERLERPQLGNNTTSDYKMERVTNNCDDSLCDPNNSLSPDYFSDSTSPEDQYCTYGSELQHAPVPYHENSATSDTKPQVYCGRYGDNPMHNIDHRMMYNYIPGFIPRRDVSAQPQQSYIHGQLHRGENVDVNFVQYNTYPPHVVDQSQHLQKTPPSIPQQCPALAVNMTPQNQPMSSSSHIRSVKLYSNLTGNIPTQCEVTCSFDHQKQPLCDASSVSQTPVNQEIKSIIATTADFGITNNTTVNTQTAIRDERLYMSGCQLDMHSNDCSFSSHFTSSQCSVSEHNDNVFCTTSNKCDMNMQDTNRTVVPQKNTKEIATDDLADETEKNPDIDTHIRTKRRWIKGSRYDEFIMKNSCLNESNLHRSSSERNRNKLIFQKKRDSHYDFRRGKHQIHRNVPMAGSSSDGYMVPRLKVMRELFRPWGQVKRTTFNKGFMECVNIKREMGIAERGEWKYNMKRNQKNRNNICNKQSQSEGMNRRESRISEEINARKLSSGQQIKTGCDGRDEILVKKKKLFSDGNIYNVKGKPTYLVSCSSDCVKTRELYKVHHKNLNLKELTNSLNNNNESKIDINTSSSESAVGNRNQGLSNVQDHKGNEYKSDKSKQCYKKLKKQKKLLNFMRRKRESAKRKTSLAQTTMDGIDKHNDLEITENTSQDSDEKSGTVILHPKLRHKILRLPISDSDYQNAEYSVTSTTNVNCECKTGIEIVDFKHKNERSKKIVNVKSTSVVRAVNQHGKRIAIKRDEKKAFKSKPYSDKNESKCEQKVQDSKSRDNVHQAEIRSVSKGKDIFSTPSTIKIKPLQTHQPYTCHVSPKSMIEKPCKMAKNQLCVKADKTDKVLDTIDESKPLSKVISEAHMVLEIQSMDGHSMEMYNDDDNFTSLNDAGPSAEHVDKPMTEYCYSVQSFNAPIVSSTYFKPIGESNVRVIGHAKEVLPEYSNEFDGSSIIETSKAVSEWSSKDEKIENMGKCVDTDSMVVDNIRELQTDKVESVSESMTYIVDDQKNQGEMINANKTEDLTVSANDSLSLTLNEITTSTSVESCKQDDSKTTSDLYFNQPSNSETLLDKERYLPSIDTVVAKNVLPQQLSYEMHLRYMKAKKELDDIDGNRSYLPSLPIFSPDPSAYIVPSATVMDWFKYEEKVIKETGSHCPNRYSPSQEDFEHYQRLQMERIKQIGLVRLHDSKGIGYSTNGGEIPRISTVLKCHYSNNLSWRPGTNKMTGDQPHGFDAVQLLCSSDSTTQTCDEMIDDVTSTNMFDTNDKEEIEKVIEEVVKEEYLCPTNSPDVENDFSWLSDERFNEGAIEDMYDKCKTFRSKSNRNGAMDTNLQFGYSRHSSIMSKRSAIRLSSRGRYNKKFPVSLPRPKYQPEKALYEAAVDFLGNFDKTNKRACRQPKEVDESQVEITANGVERKNLTVEKLVSKENEGNCDEWQRKFDLREGNITAKIDKDRVKKEEIGMRKEQKEEINTRQEQNDDSDTRKQQNEHINTRNTKNEDGDTRKQQNEHINTRTTKNEDSDTRNEQNEDGDTRKQQNENINTRNEKNEDSDTRYEQNDSDTRKDRQKKEINDDQGTKVVTKHKMSNLFPKSKTALSWTGKGLGSHGKLVSMREHFDKSSRNNLLKTSSLFNICNKTPVIKMENLNARKKLRVISKTSLSPKEKSVKEKLVKRYIRCKICKEMLDATEQKVRYHYRKFHKSWCVQCQKDLKEQDLTKHMSRNHDTPIFCGVCGVTFIYKRSFMRHCGMANHKERLKTSSCSKPIMVPDKFACESPREVVSISSEKSSDEASVYYISSSACEDVFSSPERKVKVSKSSNHDTPGMEKNSSYVFGNAFTSPEWKSSPQKTKSPKPGSSGINKLSKSTSKRIITSSERNILSSAKGRKNLKKGLLKMVKTDEKLKSCEVCKKSYKMIHAHLATKKHLMNVKLSKQKIRMMKKKDQAKIKLKRGRPKLSKETVKAKKTSN